MNANRIISLFSSAITASIKLMEREYQRHVVSRHPGKLAYPSEIDLEKMGSKKLEVRRYEQTAN
jgi:hypothetical protein